MKFKKDKYSKARGGTSKMLAIFCSECKNHICDYQKDGPGILKRMYLDRISNLKNTGHELVCGGCKQHVGTPMIYKKEKREAYRLFVGAVTKKLIKD